MMVNIKEAVKNGRKAIFQFYKDGSLWYKTFAGEVFPVPITDLGNATVNSEEKALLLMRYMRKWNEENE